MKKIGLVVGGHRKTPHRTPKLISAFIDTRTSWRVVRNGTNEMNTSCAAWKLPLSFFFFCRSHKSKLKETRAVSKQFRWLR